ncbi:alpha-galactosidase [Demequina zhanjiangensis]|uniref:alpha-galactosidase n=1 Tax=Demequina zhanjiangensis TaxID=3051659 RepID=A0ABT8FZV3_9MICO|nr:alpha-galactosidase [Demequina sp. SYSU T00b26]MDN4472425.1 alpha-galactosidase [Demequina sp. SYSU T00b26]
MAHPTSAAPLVATLTAADVEVVIDASTGQLVIAHWGAPLGHLDHDALQALTDSGVPHSDLDESAVPGLMRESARGLTCTPALRGHRGRTGFSPLFTVDSLVQNGSRCLAVLVDEALQLTLSWTFTLTPEGVLLVDASVRNDGTDDYTLDALDVWMPVPERADETLDFTGRWLKERQPQRLPFAPGLRVREGREGRSGHDHTIVQCALTSRTGTESGEAWALGLLWSGGCRHLAERDTAGRGALAAGELIEPGEQVLAAGQVYRTPTVAAFYSAEGLDGISARSHAWLRSRPTHPSSPRPVTLNVWEAVYFDHDLDRLLALAERAASVGVERFVLDDGWFGSRRDDWSGLGDWWVSPDAWPTGLAPLVSRVKELGMQFGLWFEGEMVNPDSDLYRAHPDWILQVPGRTPPLARHQLVLDLANPDAYAHVLEQVHAVVSAEGVDYIKWDHNRFLTDPAHLGVAAVRRQTEAIYSLFDELRRRNPGLEIESCASGGGRIDLGMAMHADRFWTSDQNDALERQQIQRWTTLVIPPEMLGTHIGPTDSHGTGRRHSIQMRAVTALFGHAGIEWNLLEATDDELEALRRWTALYRDRRDLLHRGRGVRVEHPDPSALVHGVVAQDRSEALFAYVQCTTTPANRPAAFRLPGLDPDSRYEIRLEDLGGAATVQRREPAWIERSVTATGAALASVGLHPPILWPEEAILVSLTRVDA